MAKQNSNAMSFSLHLSGWLCIDLLHTHPTVLAILSCFGARLCNRIGSQLDLSPFGRQSKTAFATRCLLIACQASLFEPIGLAPVAPLVRRAYFRLCSLPVLGLLAREFEIENRCTRKFHFHYIGIKCSILSLPSTYHRAQATKLIYFKFSPLNLAPIGASQAHKRLWLNRLQSVAHLGARVCLNKLELRPSLFNCDSTNKRQSEDRCHLTQIASRVGQLVGPYASWLVDSTDRKRRLTALMLCKLARQPRTTPLGSSGHFACSHLMIGCNPISARLSRATICIEQ